MKLKKIIAAIALAGVFTALAAGCGTQQDKPKDTASKQEVVRLGVVSGPHAEIAEEVIKAAEKEGIAIKMVEFSDYITPDQALADGDIDLVSYQHKPFLDNFNSQHGTDLVSIGNTYLMRMGIYSNTYQQVESFPVGGTIAVPNDPTNEGRALLLLQEAGVITLRSDVGFKATLADIEENKKQLQFREIEAAQLPRSLSDVDGAVITMTYALGAGLDLKRQGIYLESKDAPLAVMILAARAKDKDNKTYQKVAKLYHAENVEAFINEKYQGVVAPVD